MPTVSACSARGAYSAHTETPLSHRRRRTQNCRCPCDQSCALCSACWPRSRGRTHRSCNGTCRRAHSCGPLGPGRNGKLCYIYHTGESPPEIGLRFSHFAVFILYIEIFHFHPSRLYSSATHAFVLELLNQLAKHKSYRIKCLSSVCIWLQDELYKLHFFLLCSLYTCTILYL